MLRGDIVEACTRLADREAWFLPRHLLRIEDELNELGLLFIRRMVTSVNTNIIRGTFTLIVVGMLAIALFHLLPDVQTINAIVVTLSSALIAWAAMQTLHLLSYFEQQALDEVGCLLAEERDENVTKTY